MRLWATYAAGMRFVVTTPDLRDLCQLHCLFVSFCGWDVVGIKFSQIVNKRACRIVMSKTEG